MNKINQILIIILLCFIVIVLYLRFNESQDFNKQIEDLEEIQRGHFIEIDSLVISNENQEVYINELEDSVEYLDNISKLRGERIIKYKKLINERDQNYFNTVNDSIIVDILSGIRFNP